MKKLVMMLAVAAAAVVAMAEPSWKAVYSEAYENKDGVKYDGAANVGYYAAYYCTLQGAKDVFGGAQDVGAIATFLTESFGSASSALSGYTPDPSDPLVATDVQSLGNGLWLTYGEYEFKQYSPESVSDGFGFAVLLFEKGDEQAFRVFDSTSLDEAALDNGNLAYMGEAASGWAAVPEPTSALLLLLGAAGLALRRKRM